MNSHPNVTTHSFTGCHAQAAALAERIAERLRAALAERGTAVLAVSGGSTPKDFFGRLSREKLDWARVQITLVDERWVADTDERSNARLVQSTLLQHAAAAAQFEGELFDVQLVERLELTRRLIVAHDTIAVDVPDPAQFDAAGRVRHGGGRLPPESHRAATARCGRSITG